MINGKTVSIILQARMGSTRLPGKIMKLLGGKEVLWHDVIRCKTSKLADQVIVAIPDLQTDDILYEFCKKNNFLCVRGSENDVLARYMTASKEYPADIIIRITSDCPLIDPEIIDLAIKEFNDGDYDYLSNHLGDETEFPLGFAVEVFTLSVLEKTFKEASKDYEREHVTPYIYENPNKFKIAPLLKAPEYYKRDYRLTLDYEADLNIFQNIYGALYKPGEIISVKDAIIFLDKHREVATLNKESLQKSYKP